MHGIKRPASSLDQYHHTSTPQERSQREERARGKKFKPNRHHHQQQQEPQVVTSPSGIIGTILSSVKSWIGTTTTNTTLSSNTRSIDKNNANKSNRSRQKPLRQRRSIPPPSFEFENDKDTWIWNTMHAKQRAQPINETSESRILKELGKSNNRSNVSTVNGSSTGRYQKKQPMGHRENSSTPHTTTRKRYSTPDFLRNTTNTNSFDDFSSPSSDDDDYNDLAQRSLFEFVTKSLPPTTTTRFFSSPWLPRSLSRITRKQYRLALQRRDSTTIETLKTTTSTTPQEEEVPTLSTGSSSLEEFRVYKQGVTKLTRQEDATTTTTTTTNSSLLRGPTTYASVVSSSKPIRRTTFDRALENYHKTRTDISKEEEEAAKVGLKLCQLQLEQDDLQVDKLIRERETKVKQRRKRLVREWPKRVPVEISERVSKMLRETNYDKTIPGANVDSKAIKRLRPGTWLDDSIIAFYGVLINNRFLQVEKRGKGELEKEGLRKVWCFNSFFWNMYEENGYKRVKKWTKKFDVFEKDIIIFPINIRNSHWTCAAVNVKEKRFEYYDSLGNRMQKAHTLLRKWLQEEHECKKGSKIDLSDWVDYWDPDVPQQDNCNDCGVFTCAFMETLSREYKGFDFTQQQMPYLRQKIAYEIDKAELIPEKFIEQEEED